MNIRHPLKSTSRKVKVASAVAGALLAGGSAYAAVNWTVGLSTGSSANAQGAGIQSLVISDIAAAPTETDQLYPGGSGDVVFTLRNPNNYPVSVTGVTLPQESINSTGANDAVGYSTSTISGGTQIAGCGSGTGGAATASDVTWNGASSSTTTAKTFTTGTGAFAVAGLATVTVTLTNDAAMDQSSPLACAGNLQGGAYQGAYFVMPSLTAVSATAGAGALTPIANNGTVTTGW